MQPVVVTADKSAPHDRAARPDIHELIVGRSAPSMRMKRMIEIVAASPSPVLVTGPTGAGKELVAEGIHNESGRKGPLVAINCAAIPAELLESELFGYEKGAFTGAVKQHRGRFEQSSGGTLFLDEIGDMPLSLQSKLLRALESFKIQRVGGSEEVTLDLRLVCATHQDLEKMVEEGKFRADLFYRLNVFPIPVPSLADRSGDIPDILDALVQARADRAGNADRPEFDADAVAVLCAHDWPGNVRELRNVVERACVLFAGHPVTGANVRENLLQLRLPDIHLIDDQDALWEDTADLAGTLPDFGDFLDAAPATPESYRNWFDHFENIDMRGHLRDIEVVLIEAALEKSQGQVTKAADLLKLRRTTLIEKMKKLMIERPLQD
jgi:sigma-54 specific flagellar transcriptional regulator A